jgi:pyridoxal phosphate enzyme (YggS family)
MYQNIRDNVRRLLAEMPSGVSMVAAAKSRTPDEITAAIDSGITIVGENFVQEAEPAKSIIGDRPRWHFIGHLQLNKVKKAVEIFDLIETVDDFELAKSINRHSGAAGKIMPVLIEVNVGKETQKSGVLPDAVDDLARSITRLPNLRLSGLMTMGPRLEPEEMRPYFAATRVLFERLRNEHLPGTDIRYLSMGMSDSFRVAIEEGANLVRLGTAIFGPRG